MYRICRHEFIYRIMIISNDIIFIISFCFISITTIFFDYNHDHYQSSIARSSISQFQLWYFKHNAKLIHFIRTICNANYVDYFFEYYFFRDFRNVFNFLIICYDFKNCFFHVVSANWQINYNNVIIILNFMFHFFFHRFQFRWNFFFINISFIVFIYDQYENIDHLIQSNVQIYSFFRNITSMIEIVLSK